MRIEDESGQMVVASTPKVYRDVVLDVARGTCDQGAMYFAMKPSLGKEKVKGQKPKKSKGSSTSNKSAGAKNATSNKTSKAKKKAAKKKKKVLGQN